MDWRYLPNDCSVHSSSSLYCPQAESEHWDDEERKSRVGPGEDGGVSRCIAGLDLVKYLDAGVPKKRSIEPEGRSEELEEAVDFLDFPMSGGYREGGKLAGGREARARARHFISTAR